MPKKEHKLPKCLNCNFPFKGSIYNNYCPNCGQKNSDSHFSVFEIFKEFTGQILTFDSKFLKSVYNLIFKPGLLSKEFNSGYRVKYSNPVRLLLISSLLFYTLLSVSTNLELTKDGLIFRKAKVEDTLLAADGEEATTSTASNDTINKQVLADSTLNIINRQRVDSIPSASAQIDTIINEDSKPLIYIDEETNAVTFNGNGIFNDNLRIALTMVLGNEKEHTVKEVLDSSKITNPILIIGVKQVKRMKDEGTDNFTNYFVQHLSITVFLLIPFFALVMKLLYLGKGIYYIEHLVFTIHLNTAVYLFSIVGLIMSLFLNIIPIIILVLIYYQYKSMRTVYQESRFMTTVKFSLHSLISLFITALGLTGALILSFFLF